MRIRISADESYPEYYFSRMDRPGKEIKLSDGTKILVRSRTSGSEAKVNIITYGLMLLARGTSNWLHYKLHSLYREAN